jgi:hypothetical protein
MEDQTLRIKNAEAIKSLEMDYIRAANEFEAKTGYFSEGFWVNKRDPENGQILTVHHNIKPYLDQEGKLGNA